MKPVGLALMLMFAAPAAQKPIEKRVAELEMEVRHLEASMDEMEGIVDGVLNGNIRQYVVDSAAGRLVCRNCKVGEERAK